MKKATTKTPSIKVGDLVRIETPAFFVRCGYPLEFATETDRVMREKDADIRTFLGSQGITYGPYETPGAVFKIAKALAYELCRQRQWGGRDRKIYTHELPEFAGRECSVTAVRFVKTGTYSPARSGGYYNEGECDPPYLANESTHRILMLSLVGNVRPDDEMGYENALEIDAANVQQVFRVAEGDLCHASQ